MAIHPKKLSAAKEAAPLLGQGLQTYSAILQQAGGEQVRALTRLGDGRAVCAALYAAPPYDLRVPAMGVSRLSMNLTPSHVVGGIEGERGRGYDARPYSLFMAPAGARMIWRKTAPSRHLTIYYRWEDLMHDTRPTDPLAQLQAIHNLTVPGLRPLADQLVEELRCGANHGLEAAECLARLMLIHVSRHLGRRRDDPKALGPVSMKRLKDYVMAHLDSRIRVEDMARVTGLSPDQFAWHFKQQTGLSPHQFVINQRVQLAHRVLTTTQVPIAQVASDCGFSSQQHLTHVMRQRLGTTPARLRPAFKTSSRQR